MKTRILVTLLILRLLSGFTLAGEPVGNSHYQVVFDAMDSSSRATNLHVRSKKTGEETDSRHFDFDDRFRGFNTQWSPNGEHFAITFDSGETTRLVVFRLDTSGHLSELEDLPVRKDLLPEHPEAYGGYVFEKWIDNKRFQAVGRNVAASETFMHYTFRITKDEKLEVTASNLRDRNSR